MEVYVPVSEAAARFALSQRAVFRILKRAAARGDPGFLGLEQHARAA